MRARPCAASRATSRATASEPPVAGGCVRPDQDRDTRLSVSQHNAERIFKALGEYRAQSAHPKALTNVIASLQFRFCLLHEIPDSPSPLSYKHAAPTTVVED
ncbi:hypothetical protein VTO73DRAFT_15206 [Trametes versicolor]